MNYQDLNQKHKQLIETSNSINTIQYEWENKDFINILLGELPPLHITDINQNQLKTDLINLYKSYDFYSTNQTLFLTELKNIYTQLINQNKYYFDYDIFELYIKIHKSLLLNGEGGKGKTYFLYKLEEKLSEKNIKHLCIYGKYFNDISNIDFNTISQISSQEEFVFIIDAYNELSDKLQKDLLIELSKLISVKGCRIIISYRDYRLQESIITDLVSLLKNQYCFEGVSYEAALDTLSTTGISELYTYSDILYSNNALFLSFLIKALEDSKQKSKSPKFKSIVSMTNILEQEIKNSVDSANWTNTKKIAEWMYHNNSREIPISQINKLVSNAPQFIQEMKAAGYFTENNAGVFSTIKFSIESLSDSIISRSFFADLTGKSEKDIITLLINKSMAMPALTNFFIIALFDRFTPDYDKIDRILVGARLKDYLTPDVFIKINIRSENISDFQTHFNIMNPIDYLIYCSGYYNKPFNCNNFITNYLKSNKKEQLYSLNNTLSESYDIGTLIKRLKNILYFVNRIEISEKQYREEILYTALWASAAPNNTVHLLAVKLLYDIVNSYNETITLLINIYADIEDYYIKQSIIHVLSKMPENTEIKSFFNLLRNDIDDIIDEASIQLICNYLKIDVLHFFKKKRNLLIKSNNAIEKPLELLLTSVYHHRIDSHFRYLGNNNIDQVYPKFLKNTYKIKMYNKLISILNYNGFRIHKLKNLKMISNQHILNSLDIQIKRFCKMYGIENDYMNNQYIYVNDFKNSLLRKIFSLASGVLYGYLTGRYYTDDFNYESYDKNILGYNMFNSFMYDEDTNNICSPICVYQNLIEDLENSLYKNLQLKTIKDEAWGKDDNNLKTNLNLLLSPFSTNGSDWHLLAGQIKMTDVNDKWEEIDMISCNLNLELKLGNRQFSCIFQK